MLTLAVCAAVAVGAAAQWVSGVGFVLVCGPLLVTALGPREGVRLAVVLSMVVNVVVLAGAHRRIRWRDLPVLLGAALLATPLWAYAVRGTSSQLLALIAGLCAVAGAVAVGSGLRWPAARGQVGAATAGLVSAGMTVVAGIGGPAVSLYAANAGWSLARSRGTLQVYFLAVNVVALASLGPPRTGSGLVGLAVVAAVFGLGAGALACQRPAGTARSRS